LLSHDTLVGHSPLRKQVSSAEKQFRHNFEGFTKFWISQSIIVCYEKNVLTLYIVLSEEFSTTGVDLRTPACKARPVKRSTSYEVKQNVLFHLKWNNSVEKAVGGR